MLLVYSMCFCLVVQILNVAIQCLSTSSSRRCLHPRNETESWFSTEHFTYVSDVQVKKSDLSDHVKYWVAKNRCAFKPLFDSIHLNDEIKEAETNLCGSSRKGSLSVLY
jgi:hypothetical protein